MSKTEGISERAEYWPILGEDEHGNLIYALRLEYEWTPRCFVRARFFDAYGQECSIQKSSWGEQDAIWLGVDVDLEGKAVGNRMHLTRDQVEVLLTVLQKFVETGELPFEDKEE